MVFSNNFAIFSLPGNDELSLPESDSLLEEEQNLLDHENESTWLRDLANCTRFKAKPISSSLDYLIIYNVFYYHVGQPITSVKKA
jgi:hypothetical protein